MALSLRRLSVYSLTSVKFQLMNIHISGGGERGVQIPLRFAGRMALSEIE